MQVMITGKRARLAFEVGPKAEPDEEGTWIKLADGDYDVAECDCGESDCSGYTATPKAQFGFRP